MCITHYLVMMLRKQIFYVSIVVFASLARSEPLNFRVLVDLCHICLVFGGVCVLQASLTAQNHQTQCSATS